MPFGWAVFGYAHISWSFHRFRNINRMNSKVLATNDSFEKIRLCTVGAVLTISRLGLMVYLNLSLIGVLIMACLCRPDFEGIVIMVKSTPEMKRLAATIGAAVQSCRLAGMSAEQAFTVLAVHCGLQAVEEVPVEHVQKCAT